MTILRLVVLLLCCAGWLACPSRPFLASKGDPPDGHRRLGREVVPRHYALDLRIDPAAERFSGTAAIEVEIAASTRRIPLHAQGLELERAAIESGGVTRDLAATPGRNGALLLESDAALPPGRATLHFAWAGPLPQTPHGLYRVEDGGRWYAFTQFEPLEARRAFPGFDQPEFKTPFAVTLRVPAGSIALSNAPLLREDGDDRERVFVFRETRPLPTYLVAFAVGAFDLVDGAADPPTRLVATRGKGRLAGYALERTPRILSWLVDYFDQPYPFAKLDLVAVPNFGAGAMENVGLVTFRERLLLLDGDDAPIWSRYASQAVIGHELAHMWYGNLVTMPWWDDLWLNESFASWMAAKLLEDVDPELDSRLDAVLSVQDTLDLDSRRGARRIRQPIRDGGDVYNAFDAITYGKGAAVLRMIEAWIGEQSFREGVRAYMREHAYGSGGTSELLAALEQASGRAVTASLDSFLDQPGAPLVETTLECPADGSPSLRLRQTRALPAGSDAPVGRPWKIPVCVALGTGDPERPRERECFLLERREQRVELSREGCPLFVHPNDGERGYYRFRLPAEQLVALVRDHLDDLEDAEVVAIPGHYRALLEAEAIPVEDLLVVLRILARHPKRQVVSAVTDVWWTLYEVGIPDPESPVAEALAAELRGLLGPRLDRIGVLPQPRESADARLLRGPLVRALAELGGDPWIRSRARTAARDFLAKPDAVDEEVLGLLLPIAAREGDDRLWEGLVAILADPPSPGVRDTLVRALGSFEDPALLRQSLDLLLDGRLLAQDHRTVTHAIGRDQRDVAWTWLTDRYATLLSKLGPLSATGLPDVASGLCSLEDAARVEAFFATADGAPSGTRRNVELVVEKISRCARLRASIDSALARALTGA